MEGLFEAIRDYLIHVGCKIEYRILVNAFKEFLYNPDPDVQGRIRTQFKDHVNSLATVSVENNMKFIVLRPEFRQTPIIPAPTNKNESNDPPPPPPPPRPSSIQTRTSDHIIIKPPPVPEHLPLSPIKRSSQTTNESDHHQYIHHQHQQQQNSHKLQQQQSLKQSRLMKQDNTDCSIENQQQYYQQQVRREPLSPKQQHGDTAQMPPPRPPPRRRQSNASLFSKPDAEHRTTESRSHNELNDLAKKSPGKVRERALKLNSYSVSGDLNSMTNLVKSHSMRENRLSRDSTIASLSSASQRLGYNPSMRSRSSHREDESDSSSFQPMDVLRKKWTIEACNCSYNGLASLLREDQRLAGFKDTVGYTALHWAAKAGNLDIINLIAGTCGVSADLRSNSGYTPLHLAHMFKRNEAINLLLNVYNANPTIRDYSGRRPHQLNLPT